MMSKSDPTRSHPAGRSLPIFVAALGGLYLLPGLYAVATAIGLSPRHWEPSLICTTPGILLLVLAGFVRRQGWAVLLAILCFALSLTAAYFALAVLVILSLAALGEGISLSVHWIWLPLLGAGLLAVIILLGTGLTALDQHWGRPRRQGIFGFPVLLPRRRQALGNDG